MWRCENEIMLAVRVGSVRNPCQDAAAQGRRGKSRAIIGTLAPSEDAARSFASRLNMHLYLSNEITFLLKTLIEQNHLIKHLYLH